MRNKILFCLLVLFLIPALSLNVFAAKVPAPDKGGDLFQAVTLEEAKGLMEKGATVVACHSHTTDFMDGHPQGTIHITCLVPKDHKRVDLSLDKINFDIQQLPKDKSTNIIMYCASGTWWKSYQAARLAVANGYTNIKWMRDGKKGWIKKGYPVVSQKQTLEALKAVNKHDFGAAVISKEAARKLPKCTFIDFRTKAQYDTGHVKDANHVDYAKMFTKPMMEELNKSNSLIIIHDAPQVAGVIAATLKMMDYPAVYILK